MTNIYCSPYKPDTSSLSGILPFTMLVQSLSGILPFTTLVHPAHRPKHHISSALYFSRKWLRI
jgi:hypothetical protein